MTFIARCLALTLLLAALGWAQQSAPPAEPPLEWVEPETGRRVIRLSREPGSASLYFHQNAYTATGDKLVITTPKGISTIELRTGKIELIVEGHASSLVVGRKTRQVFYIKDGAVFATHLDTKATREIVKQPELRTGSGLAVNADETLLGGSFVKGGARNNFQPPASAAPGQRPDSYPGKDQMMEQRLAARLPMALYTINIKTGELKTFHHSTDWLNHVQFSPTDPTLLIHAPHAGGGRDVSGLSRQQDSGQYARSGQSGVDQIFADGGRVFPFGRQSAELRHDELHQESGKAPDRPAGSPAQRPEPAERAVHASADSR